MSPEFFDKLNAIDQIISKDWSQINFDSEIKPFLDQKSTESYFYNKLESPNWLEVLSKSGVFLNPPLAERNDTGLVSSYPMWHPINYLANIAKEKPKEVTEILLTFVENTDNFYIQQKVVEIIGSLPARYAKLFVSSLKSWSMDLSNRYVSDLISSYILQLLRKKLWKESIELLEFEMELFWENGKETGRGIDLWSIQDILDELITAGKRDSAFMLLTFSFLCKQLNRSLEQSKRNSPEDYSQTWRPTIEKSEVSEGFESFDNMLVDAIRDCLSPEKMPDKFIHELQKYPWFIFRRMELHLIKVCKANTTEFSTQYLTKEEFLLEPALWTEYSLLLKKKFSLLSPDTQKVLIEKIFEVQKNARLAIYTEQHRKEWILRRLTVIRKHLHGAHEDYYQALKNELKTEKKRIAVNDTVGWFSNEQDEKDLLSVDELVRELTSPLHKSPLVKDSLRSILENDPQTLYEFLDFLSKSDPEYVLEALKGLNQAVRKRRSINGDVLVDICYQQFVRKSVFEDVQANALLSEANNLFFDLLSNEKKSFTIQCLQKLSSIIEVLVKDSRTEAPKTAQDVGAMLLNSKRGRAIYCMIHFGQIANDFAKELMISEPTTNLIDHTIASLIQEMEDTSHQPQNLARAACGEWFPYIVSWKLSEAEYLRDVIFPTLKNIIEIDKDVAWLMYLEHSAPYAKCFELLDELYKTTILNLRKFEVNHEQIAKGLSMHLAAFCAQGKLGQTAEKDVLYQFFCTASIALKEHFVGFIGENIFRRKPHPLAAERFQCMWNQHLKMIEHKLVPTDDLTYLRQFGWWFISDAFETKWALENLEKCVSHIHSIEPNSLVVQKLNKLKSIDVNKVLRVISTLYVPGKDYYFRGEEISCFREILCHAFASKDKGDGELAFFVANQLGSLGLIELRELIVTKD